MSATPTEPANPMTENVSPVPVEPEAAVPSHDHTAPTMLPASHQRPALESAFVRIVATGGVVGIGVAIAAILASQNVQGWIIGLVVSVVSVIVSAVLWSSREV